MSRYVQVKFPHGMRPPHWNDRAYLYLSDIALEVGDRVVVPVHDGSAERDAIVFEVGRGSHDYPGPYDTVIRKVPRDSTYTSRQMNTPVDENGNPIILTFHHEPRTVWHEEIDPPLEERLTVLVEMRVMNNYAASRAFGEILRNATA